MNAIARRRAARARRFERQRPRVELATSQCRCGRAFFADHTRTAIEARKKHERMHR